MDLMSQIHKGGFDESNPYVKNMIYPVYVFNLSRVEA